MGDLREYFRRIQAMRDARAAKFGSDSPPQSLAPDAADRRQRGTVATARDILAAGELARSGKAIIPEPTDETAKRILRAGEMARAGGPPREPLTGLAARIIAAGKKARGEIE